MMGTLNLTINMDAITRPADMATAVCTEIVDFVLLATQKADLSQAPINDDNRFRVLAPFTPEARKAIYENWILARAFQDLIRAVRQSLEEAHFALQIVHGPKQVQASSTLEELLAPLRKRSSDVSFPQLLAEVNQGLGTRLLAPMAFTSTQWRKVAASS